MKCVFAAIAVALEKLLADQAEIDRLRAAGKKVRLELI